MNVDWLYAIISEPLVFWPLFLAPIVLTLIFYVPVEQWRPLRPFEGWLKTAWSAVSVASVLLGLVGGVIALGQFLGYFPARLGE